MSVSPLQHIGNFESYKSGEVTIDPSAAIAIGVVLKAEPNSQIIIGKGVCIGMGAILHAYDGILEVEAGANLGASVLVVGEGKIGANACIGLAATILNPSIKPGQVIASGSIIGDSSRQAEPKAAKNTTASDSVEVAITVTSPQEKQESTTNQLVPESANSSAPIVYGKASLNRLIGTLFPHKQLLSQPHQDGSSQSNST